MTSAQTPEEKRGAAACFPSALASQQRLQNWAAAALAGADPAGAAAFPSMRPRPPDPPRSSPLPAQVAPARSRGVLAVSKRVTPPPQPLGESCSSARPPQVNEVWFLKGISRVSLPPPAEPSSEPRREPFDRGCVQGGQGSFLLLLFPGCRVCPHSSQLQAAGSRAICSAPRGFQCLLAYLWAREFIYAKPNSKRGPIHLASVLQPLVAGFSPTFALCCLYQDAHEGTSVVPCLFSKLLFNLIRIQLSYGL